MQLYGIVFLAGSAYNVCSIYVSNIFDLLFGSHFGCTEYNGEYL